MFRSRFAAASAAALILLTAGCGADQGNATAETGISADQLRSAAGDEEAVRRFYEARQWQPAWSAQQAEGLMETLRGAGRHGLDPAHFIQDIDRAQDPVAREVAMTKAALAYADALARGRTDPARLAEVYTLPRPEADVAAGLAQALGQGAAGEWIEGLAPQDAEYRALSQAYVQAIEANSRSPHQPIPAGETIRPGGRDGRVPQIAAALTAAGYLQNAGEVGDAYAPAIVDAVKRLQQDNGVEADGLIGAGTLRLINASSPGHRARALALNLERRRWLAREAPGTRIDVNTAATFLDYYRDGARVDRRVVVVGEPGWETPELGSPIFRLVANPTWTVPTSIAESELANVSQAYLQRQGMERRNGRLVQQPGPRNALGQVKFDMQNDHAIYLHDTPAKANFALPERHLSHGCVRVHDALGFARMIAQSDGKLDEFNRALASGEESFVSLSAQIPVRLLYHTAYLDGDRIVYRPDPYGWDDRVAQALGLPVEPRAQAERRQRQGGDTGP